MFWGFLLFAGLAAVFVQLGAMSVWLTVLKAQTPGVCGV